MLKVTQFHLKILAQGLGLVYLMSTCAKQFSQSFPNHKDHGNARGIKSVEITL
jgi:hypothetical protein